MRRQAWYKRQSMPSEPLMIQTIVTHKCPRCESTDLVKNGRDYKGSQKFRCKACGRYGTLNAQRGYPPTMHARVRRGLLERLSMRGLGRMLGLSRHTISRWLKKWIQQSPPDLVDSLLPSQLGDVLELDELWSFVGNKRQQRWLWLALCRRTRQVVAYWLGDRSENSAVQLWLQIPREYIRCRSFSDRWEAYRHVFDVERHRMVDKKSGETNHVERWFNTLRQRLARFTRKTLSFSKRDDIHQALLHRFIYQYNLSRIS